MQFECSADPWLRGFTACDLGQGGRSLDSIKEMVTLGTASRKGPCLISHEEMESSFGRPGKSLTQ